MKRTILGALVLLLPLLALAKLLSAPRVQITSYEFGAATPDAQPATLTFSDNAEITLLTPESGRRHVAESRAAARPRGEVALLGAAAARPSAEDAATAALREAARAIEAAWREGDGERAQALLAEHGVPTFESAGGLVQLTACYRAVGHSGRMSVEVDRSPGRDGPAAVAFPPGTYGTANSTVQDLALLRGAVIVLPSGEAHAEAEFPVACASFRKQGPSQFQSYQLARFAAGSDVERLLAGLCAGAPASEPEAQLAVWLTRNDHTTAELLSKGGVVTFESNLPVRVSHGAGAARLMRRAGLDPARAAFFRGERQEAFDPSAL
jgi:hypothetical protein